MNLPLIAGDDYLAAMTRRRADVETRVAFTAQVERLVVPGSRILDFGCGPGLDALHYAARGYTVTGFDIDPRMRATYRRLCAEPLRRGQVKLDAADTYEAFLATPRAEAVDLVTANFAPLNLVADLGPLFAQFATRLAAHGQVLASVLNPFCLGDARSGWWWRHLPALLVRQRYVVGAGVHRRTPSCMAREVGEHFRLTDVWAGTRADRHASGGRLFISQYLFVRFQRA